MTVDVERWLPLVRKLARRHAPEQDFDDAVIDGLVAAWQALDSYDGTTGSLIGWLTFKIRGAIIDGSRHRTGWRRFPHVEMLTLEGRRETVSGRTDDPERRAVVADGVRRTRQRLSVADRELFDGLIAGRSQQDIAAEQGVDAAEVSRRVAKIRERLANNM